VGLCLRLRFERVVLDWVMWSVRLGFATVGYLGGLHSRILEKKVGEEDIGLCTIYCFQTTGEGESRFPVGIVHLL